MIKLQVIGHLGKDGSVNTVNGKSVINFSIAHTEKFKDAQGVLKEKTIWVDCAHWTDKTGIVPYLKKGKEVYAEGTPEVRTYQTSEGKPGASLSLRILSVQLLGSKSSETQESASPNYNLQNGYSVKPVLTNTVTADEVADDLPF